MNKGLIMEIKKDYAIVLRDDGIMEKIEIKPTMVIGQKIFYFEEDIVKISGNKNYKINNLIKTFGSIAALFLLVFTFFHNVMFDNTYAVVSLDINPSIQIEADSKKNIIKVEGKNDDGKNIDFDELKGLNINDGIQQIKEILIEKEYLINNKDVLVGLAFAKSGNNTSYEETIKETVCSTFKTENITYLKAETKEDIDEAKEQGISLGRYEAYKVVDENTKKKINNAPIKEITAQIKDKENVIYWDASEDEAKDLNMPSSEDKSNLPENSEEQSANSNSKESADSKNEKKPNIVIPNENKNDKAGINSKVGNDNMPSQGNDILELEPEKPVINDKEESNESNDTVSNDSNTESKENNTSTGKFEEDNNEIGNNLISNK